MRKFLGLLFSGACFFAHAQNLVKNPSFEAYDDCPTFFSEVHPPDYTGSFSVTDWYRPTGGSSDYYNACSPSVGMVNVPYAFVYQESKDGDGFVGAYCPNSEFYYHEYLQGRLTAPLISGHEIYTSFWAVLADDWDFDEIGLMDLGIHFSTDYIYEASAISLTVTPQVISAPDFQLTDTVEWALIDGSFTASGGEEWLNLGNFPTGDLTGTGINYVFFDKLCVLDIDGAAEVTSRHDTVLCGGTPVWLTADAEGSRYAWDDGSHEPGRTVTEGGTYWRRTIDEQNCRVLVDTFLVIDRATPAALNLGNDTIVCANAPLVLTAEDSLFDSYRWSSGETSPSIIVKYPGTYFVHAASACYEGTDTIVVSGVPLPLAVLPGDTVLCSGTSLALRASQDEMFYSWNTGSEECCITVEATGMYEVRLTNRCGDMDSDEINVVYSGCEQCLLAPDAFSPNGDGLNDRFEVKVNCLTKDYQLSIFNRWGQRVFSSFNSNDQWDGTVNGQPSDLGVYFYYIEATPVIEDIGKLSRKGDLVLIR